MSALLDLGKRFFLDSTNDAPVRKHVDPLCFSSVALDEKGQTTLISERSHCSNDAGSTLSSASSFTAVVDPLGTGAALDSVNHTTTSSETLTCADQTNQEDVLGGLVVVGVPSSVCAEQSAKKKRSNRRFSAAATPAKRLSPHRAGLSSSTCPTSPSTESSVPVGIREVSDSECNTKLGAEDGARMDTATLGDLQKCPGGSSASATASPVVVPPQPPMLTPARHLDAAAQGMQQVMSVGEEVNDAPSSGGWPGGLGQQSGSHSDPTRGGGEGKPIISPPAVVSPTSTAAVMGTGASSASNTPGGHMRYAKNILARSRSAVGGVGRGTQKQKPPVLLRAAAGPITTTATVSRSVDPTLARNLSPAGQNLSTSGYSTCGGGSTDVLAEGQLIAVADNTSNHHHHSERDGEVFAGGVIAAEEISGVQPCTSLSRKRRKRKNYSTASSTATMTKKTVSVTSCLPAAASPPCSSPPACGGVGTTAALLTIPKPVALIDMAKLHEAHRKKRHLRQVARQLTKKLFPLASASSVLYPSQSNARAPVTMVLQPITAEYVENEEDKNSDGRTGARLIAEFIRDHWLLGIDVADRPPANLPYERYLTPTLDTNASPTAAMTLSFPSGTDASGAAISSARSVASSTGGGGGVAVPQAATSLPGISMGTTTTSTMMMMMAIKIREGQDGSARGASTPAGMEMMGTVESESKAPKKKMGKKKKKKKSSSSATPTIGAAPTTTPPPQDSTANRKEDRPVDSITDENDEEEEEPAQQQTISEVGEVRGEPVFSNLLLSSSSSGIQKGGGDAPSVVEMRMEEDLDARPSPPVLTSSRGTRHTNGVASTPTTTSPVQPIPLHRPLSMLTPRGGSVSPATTSAGSGKRTGSSLPFTRHSSIGGALLPIVRIPSLPLLSREGNSAALGNPNPSSMAASSTSLAGGSARSSSVPLTPRDTRRNLDRLRYIAGGRRTLWDGNAAAAAAAVDTNTGYGLDDEPPLYLYHVIDPRFANESAASSHGAGGDWSEKENTASMEDVMTRPHTYIRWRRIWEEQCRTLGLMNAPIVNIYVLQQQPSMGFVPPPPSYPEEASEEATAASEVHPPDGNKTPLPSGSLWVALPDPNSEKESSRRKKKKTAPLLSAEDDGQAASVDLQEKAEREEGDAGKNPRGELHVYPVPSQWEDLFMYVTQVERPTEERRLYGPSSIATATAAEARGMRAELEPQEKLTRPCLDALHPTNLEESPNQEDTNSTKTPLCSPWNSNATEAVAHPLADTLTQGGEGFSSSAAAALSLSSAPSAASKKRGWGFGAMCVRAAQHILEKRGVAEAEEGRSAADDPHYVQPLPVSEVPVERFAHPLDVGLLSLDDVAAHRAKRRHAWRMRRTDTGAAGEGEEQPVTAVPPSRTSPVLRLHSSRRWTSLMSASADPNRLSLLLTEEEEEEEGHGEAPPPPPPLPPSDRGLDGDRDSPSVAAPSRPHKAEEDEDVEEDGGLSSTATGGAIREVGEEEKAVTLLTSSCPLSRRSGITSEEDGQSTCGAFGEDGEPPAGQELAEVREGVGERRVSIVRRDDGEKDFTPTTTACSSTMVYPTRTATSEEKEEDWAECEEEEADYIQIPVAAPLRVACKW